MYPKRCIYHISIIFLWEPLLLFLLFSVSLLGLLYVWRPQDPCLSLMPTFVEKKVIYLPFLSFFLFSLCMFFSFASFFFYIFFLHFFNFCIFFSICVYFLVWWMDPEKIGQSWTDLDQPGRIRTLVLPLLTVLFHYSMAAFSANLFGLF